jgi:hypothetical protein
VILFSPKDTAFICVHAVYERLWSWQTKNA